VSAPSTRPAPLGITVRELIAHPELEGALELRTGEGGLDRPIDHPRIQKSGLVLVGHYQGMVPSRVQIFGETELSFFLSQPRATRTARAEGLFAQGLSCVVITRGVDPPEELLRCAEATHTPLFAARPRSSTTIGAIHRALDRLLAPQESLHGVMVSAYGIGILLLGPSGIGKSECALFLVERGHRLVADDRVRLTRMPDMRVLAAADPLLKHHIEIRGIGILNIRHLFGATAVLAECNVDLVVELCHWEEEASYERLGLDEERLDLLGVSLPKLRIPVRPGRDMGVILEVAARNQLLKAAGHHSARAFVERLSKGLGLQELGPDAKAPGPPRPPGAPGASEGEAS
jgi:HPr kinase/phosphorylase